MHHISKGDWIGNKEIRYEHAIPHDDKEEEDETKLVRDGSSDNGDVSPDEMKIKGSHAHNGFVSFAPFYPQILA